MFRRDTITSRLAGSNLVPNQTELDVAGTNCMNSMQLGINGVNEFSVEWE